MTAQDTYPEQVPAAPEPHAAGIALDLPTPHATEALADALAGVVMPGDCLLLSGDLGAGKTTFARALIRALAHDPALIVPSPTFTLVQTYDLPTDRRLLHADFYRLGDPSETAELGLDEIDDGAILIAEWPERGEVPATDATLSIMLRDDAAGGRAVALGPGSGWRARLDRAMHLTGFLDRAGWGAAHRALLQGDASMRRYEKLSANGRSAILMDAPARHDPGLAGAPSYSRQVHLAEDIRPFVAVANGLSRVGLSAPRILAADMAHGFLLVDDLGADTIASGGKPVTDGYIAAAEVLAVLHAEDRRPDLPVEGDDVHVLPDYSTDVMVAEAGLLADWYAPHALGAPLPDEAVTAFRAAVGEMVAPVQRPTDDVPAFWARTWVLRDYHSPNLIWRPRAGGTERIGLIDFQDALHGPAGYDLASLTFDARVDMPAELSAAVTDSYLRALAELGLAVDEAVVQRDLAILSAQRNAKILGIFVRLAQRDGKPGYLAHLPRILGYMRTALAHPACAPLRDWSETWLPRLVVPD